MAVKLNLTGYARNLPDGDVEVLACGALDAVDQLLEWLQHGPPMASVAGVKETTVSCEKPQRFAIA